MDPADHDLEQRMLAKYEPDDGLHYEPETDDEENA